MTTYVALLRGINVGGNRKITMADLRTMFAAAGAENVTTYIQSGNVVFRHSADTPGRLTSDLERQITVATGFEVPLTLRTAEELATVIAGTPFPTTEPTQLHVTFLDAPAPAGAFDGVDRAAFAPEDFAVSGRELYLYLPHGMARTKLPQALGLYRRHAATTRNWRTVVTLHDLAAGN
jgi:uncharacterized protein (DUF1697 family)